MVVDVIVFLWFDFSYDVNVVLFCYFSVQFEVLISYVDRSLDNMSVYLTCVEIE